jgi:hypothetical protein
MFWPREAAGFLPGDRFGLEILGYVAAAVMLVGVPVENRK